MSMWRIYVDSSGVAIPAESAEQAEKINERVKLRLIAAEYKRQKDENQRRREAQRESCSRTDSGITVITGSEPAACQKSRTSVSGSISPAACVEKRRYRASFYKSPGWKKVRFEALKRSNGRCDLCGRTASRDVVLHVDHIKPRSKYPDLALDINNLQVLCQDCNLGKGNRDSTDWRNR